MCIRDSSIGAYIQNKAFATEWRPDDPLVTFGIFSDANYLSKTLSPSVVTFYISIVLVLASIQFLFSWKNIKGLPTFNDKEKIFLYTYGTFFILNMLYANFDYRLPILIPLILLFAKSPVPNATSSPFSLYKVASAVNRFFDLNRTFPIASILPELTGFVM